MNKDREDQIVAAYQAWDGDATVETFARSRGVSKQTLYTLLRKRNIPTKTVTEAVQGLSRRELAVMDMGGDMLRDHMFVEFLYEKFSGLVLLEDRVRVLEEALRGAGIDPDEV